MEEVHQPHGEDPVPLALEVGRRVRCGPQGQHRGRKGEERREHKEDRHGVDGEGGYLPAQMIESRRTELIDPRRTHVQPQARDLGEPDTTGDLGEQRRREEEPHQQPRTALAEEGQQDPHRDARMAIHRGIRPGIAPSASAAAMAPVAAYMCGKE